MLSTSERIRRGGPIVKCWTRGHGLEAQRSDVVRDRTKVPATWQRPSMVSSIWGTGSLARASGRRAVEFDGGGLQSGSLEGASVQDFTLGLRVDEQRGSTVVANQEITGRLV